jgi:hypothetical protein
MWDSPLHLLILAIIVLILFGGRNLRPRKPPNHPLPASDPQQARRVYSKRRSKFWHAINFSS